MKKITNPDNRCTMYFNHPDWVKCCQVHDDNSLAAWVHQDPKERLKADQALRDCVQQSGHPIHAEIMYFGVRAWFWLKWWLIDGIRFQEGTN